MCEPTVNETNFANDPNYRQNCFFGLVLTNLGYPNYQQGCFSIDQFRNKAVNLAGANPLIVNAIAQIGGIPRFNFQCFDRVQLIAIWNNPQVSFETKVLLTFWWGGISHQFQAPKFYTAVNLANFAINTLAITGGLNAVPFNQINFGKIFHECPLKTINNS